MDAWSENEVRKAAQDDFRGTLYPEYVCMSGVMLAAKKIKQEKGIAAEEGAIAEIYRDFVVCHLGVPILVDCVLAAP